MYQQETEPTVFNIDFLIGKITESTKHLDHRINELQKHIDQLNSRMNDLSEGQSKISESLKLKEAQSGSLQRLIKIIKSWWVAGTIGIAALTYIGETIHHLPTRDQLNEVLKHVSS